MKKHQKEAADPEEKVGTFLERNRKPILICSIIILLAAIGVAVAFAVIEKTNEEGIAKVDSIEYSLSKDTASLADDQLASRINTAIEALGPYLGKKGIVGVRANMLAADISFQKKDFENSRTYYLAAAAASKKAYTAPVCAFNAAVCSEELNDNESAAKQYESSLESKDFLLAAHALFSLGRVKESLGDFTGAAQSYLKLATSYPDDDWTKLGQSRLIELKASGKVADDVEAAADTETTK